jgi:hypothetical protein
VAPLAPIPTISKSEFGIPVHAGALKCQKGGHFAAFEQPDLFVREVREFFMTLRQA